MTTKQFSIIDTSRVTSIDQAHQCLKFLAAERHSVDEEDRRFRARHPPTRQSQAALAKLRGMLDSTESAVRTRLQQLIEAN